jgi:hypothetical protein
MQNLTEKELCERYVLELFERGMNDEQFVLILCIDQAMCLFATLQLALRHPGLENSATAAVTRAIASGLEKDLGATPAIAEACRRGWVGKYDVVDHAHQS